MEPMSKPSATYGWPLAMLALALLCCLQTWRLQSLQRRLDSVLSATVSPASAARQPLAREVTSPERLAAQAAKLHGKLGRRSTAAAPDPSGGSRATPPAPVAVAGEVRPVDADPALLDAAREALSKGDYDNAVTALNKALDRDPNNAAAYQMMAGICKNLGLRDDERFYYEGWARAQPDNGMPCYNLARLYADEGLKEQAQAAARRFEELTPGSAAAAASLYRQLNLAAEEGQALQAWVTAAPTSVDAHRWLAEYDQRTNNAPGALAEYQRILEISPGDVEAHVSLAGVYQSQQQSARAQAELATAVSLRPGDMNLRLRLGDAYRQTGNLDSALVVYQGIVQFAPDSAAGRTARQILDSLQRPAPQPVP